MPSGAEEVGLEVCPPAGQKAGPVGAAPLGSFQPNPVVKEGGPSRFITYCTGLIPSFTRQILAKHLLCAEH